MKQKTISGIVVSAKMPKTVVVSIEKKSRHPLYGKVVIRHKKLKAHDEIGCKEGDVVEISMTRPIAKNVHFQVVEKLTPKS